MGPLGAVGLFFTTVVAGAVGLVGSTTDPPLVGVPDRNYHIQEAPGAMEKLAEMSPTDYYYDKLSSYLVE
jgi:hypothetical protein